MPKKRKPADGRRSLNRLVRCALTTAEASHLLYLIEVNERDKWYIEPREQYWTRSQRIKAKLTGASNEKALPRGGAEGQT